MEEIRKKEIVNNSINLEEPVYENLLALQDIKYDFWGETYEVTQKQIANALYKNKQNIISDEILAVWAQLMESCDCITYDEEICVMLSNISPATY